MWWLNVNSNCWLLLCISLDLSTYLFHFQIPLSSIHPSIHHAFIYCAFIHLSLSIYVFTFHLSSSHVLFFLCEGFGEGAGRKSWVGGGGESREHQNQGQGPSDPQVSKVLGALCPQGVIGAQSWTSWDSHALFIHASSILLLIHFLSLYSKLGKSHYRRYGIHWN